MNPSLCTVQPVSLNELNNHDVLLQSGFWGEYKSRFGHKPSAFIIDINSKKYSLLLLERPAGGVFSLGYIPFGPVPLTGEEEDIKECIRYLPELAESLSKHLHPKCVFIRYDFPWTKEQFAESGIDLEGIFIKSTADIQPPCTVILDVSKDEETILQQMKSKTRYNIRLAERKGVEVLSGGIDSLPAWYEMYRETSERDRIAIHSYEYYHTLLTFQNTYGHRKPEIILLLAKIEGEIAAGNIIAFYGTKAVYLYGASRSLKRNYMPTYALQWHGIKLAKEKGCSEYDLFGIPPDSDPKHPMHGLYRFKTGFGGRIVRRTGSWDYPVHPFLYRFLTGAEKARTYYFKKLRKR